MLIDNLLYIIFKFNIHTWIRFLFIWSFASIADDSLTLVVAVSIAFVADHRHNLALVAVRNHHSLVAVRNHHSLVAVKSLLGSCLDVHHILILEEILLVVLNCVLQHWSCGVPQRRERHDESYWSLMRSCHSGIRHFYFYGRHQRRNRLCNRWHTRGW